MTVTHLRVSRSETLSGGRVVSIDELREYITDLDLTAVPDDKVAEHVQDAIFNHDDPFGELAEWLDKHNECTDSETSVTAFRHTCAGCGEPIDKTDAGWIDVNYWLVCGGFRGGQDAPRHTPAEPVEPEPAPEPTPGPWPESDAERVAFVAWQYAVGNGDTESSFRDWLAAEWDAENAGDGED